MRGHKLRVRNAKTKQRELFARRRSFAFLLFLAVSALAMLVLYTVFDNQRLRVDRQDVSIPSLPRALDGFTFLPISDLHGREFGESQSDILSALGTAQYDAVLFLGDMCDNASQNPAPFYALIDALAPSGKPMFYAKGNHDPDDYLLTEEIFRPSDYLQGIIDRGVVPLDRPVKLRETGDGDLWLWPADRLAVDAQAGLETARANLERELLRDNAEGAAQAAASRLLIENYEAMIAAREDVAPEDCHIAAGHYPLTPSRYALLEEYEGASPSVMDVDLMLAGHYHAGQYRLPGIGALAVRDPELPRGGLFPDQAQVAGLSRVGGVRQYVSRGLGASGPAFLRFRLFNTPEVSLLKLTSRVE
jgi:predicted MPP superfamily phosphohydrolase